MGFIDGIKCEYSRKCAENLFPNILAHATVCAMAFSWSFAPLVTHIIVEANFHQQAFPIRSNVD